MSLVSCPVRHVRTAAAFAFAAASLLAAIAPAGAALLNTYTGGRTDGQQIYFDGTSNITASASGFSFADSGPDRVVNGSGFYTDNGANVNPLLVPPNFIDKDLDTVFPDQNDGGSNTQWLFDATGTINQQWLAFDLGVPARLDEIKIWNSSQSGQFSRGIATAYLWVSMADSPSISPSSSGASPGPDWVMVGSDVFNILIASATANVDDNITTINLGSVTARHVLLDIETSHGSTNFIGLGEMQFFGNPIPEPTIACLMLGLLGVLAARRSRRRGA